MEFNWIGKTKSNGCTADVTVSINKNGPNKKQTCFTFRNGSDSRISKTGYAVLSVTSNKIYFKQAESKEGFSLYSKPNESVHRFKLGGELNAFVGDYDLCWDAKEKLHYIDASLKK